MGNRVPRVILDQVNKSFVLYIFCFFSTLYVLRILAKFKRGECNRLMNDTYLCNLSFSILCICKFISPKSWFLSW